MQKKLEPWVSTEKEDKGKQTQQDIGKTRQELVLQGQGTSAFLKKKVMKVFMLSNYTPLNLLHHLYGQEKIFIYSSPLLLSDPDNLAYSPQAEN